MKRLRTLGRPCGSEAFLKLAAVLFLWLGQSVLFAADPNPINLGSQSKYQWNYSPSSLSVGFNRPLTAEEQRIADEYNRAQATQRGIAQYRKSQGADNSNSQ